MLAPLDLFQDPVALALALEAPKRLFDALAFSYFYENHSIGFTRPAFSNALCFIPAAT